MAAARTLLPNVLVLCVQWRLFIAVECSCFLRSMVAVHCCRMFLFLAFNDCWYCFLRSMAAGHCCRMRSFFAFNGSYSSLSHVLVLSVLYQRLIHTLCPFFHEFHCRKLSYMYLFCVCIRPCIPANFFFQPTRAFADSHKCDTPLPYLRVIGSIVQINFISGKFLSCLVASATPTSPIFTMICSASRSERATNPPTPASPIFTIICSASRRERVTNQEERTACLEVNRLLVT